MKIVAIFAIVKNSLLAVQFEGSMADEFALLFSNWQDVEYLEQFFEDNKNDLQSGFWGNISVEEAVLRTLDEAEEMEEYIMEIAETGRIDSGNTLQDLVFQPLSKNDFSIQHVKSKSYGPDNPSWLRLYAIQVASNLYVVSGGAIKLTETMNKQAHLVLELKKLQATKEYIEQIGLLNEEDYEFVEIMSHD
ncbi:MAG: hypothetical protein K9H16_04915 [Bacteroidales bacterium]|nr:hypothetical protein [Bacteroidales bacterium]